MAFDFSALAGPLGGVLAIAYGAGAASGYAFCLRTMYKILKAQADKDESDCERRIDQLNHQCEKKDEEIKILNERLQFGLSRQAEQISRSGLYLKDNK